MTAKTTSFYLVSLSCQCQITQNGFIGRICRLYSVWVSVFCRLDWV